MRASGRLSCWWCVFVTLAALVLQPASASPSVFQATCSVPAKTLSFDCDSTCNDYEPCLLQASSSVECDVECFTIDSASPSAYKYFRFLIPYDATVGDTITTAHKNNSALTTFATAKLPLATTDVYVSIIAACCFKKLF